MSILVWVYIAAPMSIANDRAAEQVTQEITIAVNDVADDIQDNADAITALQTSVQNNADAVTALQNGAVQDNADAITALQGGIFDTLTVQAANNQLVIAPDQVATPATKTFTINASAPTNNRVLTISDPGADAYFLLGGQYTTDTVYWSGPGISPKSNSIHYKLLGEFCILTVETFQVSPANITFFQCSSPSAIRPAATLYRTCIIKNDNSQSADGYFTIETNDKMYIGNGDWLGDFTGAGACGMYEMTIVYRLA